MERKFYVYILSSKKNGTLYIGVTGNIEQRIFQHKNKISEGFTKKYNVTRLMYFEIHDTFDSAVTREKYIKNWSRQWKINLIEKSNPQWLYLYEGLFE